jgi:hypothetical protein
MLCCRVHVRVPVWCTLPPSRLPLNRQIGRQKRLFATMDIAQLLRDRGIDYSVPGTRGGAVASAGAVCSLPIEPFDDTDFEPRSSEVCLLLTCAPLTPSAFDISPHHLPVTCSTHRTLLARPCFCHTVVQSNRAVALHSNHAVSIAPSLRQRCHA